MARPEPIIPVSAKMYRHFAIITVIVTGCLAMFADGEKREAIAAQIADNQQQQDMRRVEQDLAKKGKGGNSSFKFTNKRRSRGSFGDDAPLPDRASDSSVGVYSPPELVAGRPATFSGPLTSPVTGAVIPESPPPGMTIEEFEKLRRQAAKPQTEPRKPTRAELDQFREASMARSQTRKF